MISSMIQIPLYQAYLEEQGNLAPRTLMLYVRVASQFLKTTPQLDDPESYIQFLIDTAKRKRNTANFYALKSFIGYYITNTQLKNLIIERMKQLNIKQQDPIHYLDKKPLNTNELNSILVKFSKYKDYVISLLMIETGMRIGDVMKIVKDAIYYESEQDTQVLKIRYFGKGNKSTIKWIWNLAVAGVIVDYMNKHDSNTEFIFVDQLHPRQNRMDTPINIAKVQDTNRKYFWDDLKMTLRICNIDPSRFSCHSFRRDYARKMYNWCKDIDSLKKLMGHSRIETTARYLQQEGYDVKDITKDFYFKDNIINT